MIDNRLICVISLTVYYLILYVYIVPYISNINTLNIPTINNYTNLQEAFSYINENLFNNELPNCLITYQRKKNTFGYFVNNRFQDKTNATYMTDEISLNPATFIDRSTKEILSTLAHEMCHLWQHHNGKPSRSGYHNAEWVTKMTEIGLIASNTGKPGGNQTGQQMTHYILENGVFDETIKPLVDKTILFEDRQLSIKQKLVAKTKKNSKSKYTCIGCNTNIWGKPGLSVNCNDCKLDFVPYETNESEL